MLEAEALGGTAEELELVRREITLHWEIAVAGAEVLAKSEEVAPRVEQVTSWPRASASTATAWERNTEPPSTRIFTGATLS